VPIHHGLDLMEMADPSETQETPKMPTKRPNVMARTVAGIGVVVAALVPIAALVFLILHIVNAVTFT
jgi:hypothetical protein